MESQTDRHCATEKVRERDREQDSLTENMRARERRGEKGIDSQRT